MPFQTTPKFLVRPALDDNSTQQTAGPDHKTPSEFIDLPCDSFLVEFHERVDIPLDLMGQRSSLVRFGVLIHASVMDSGYKGPIGAMMQVVNPHGLTIDWRWEDGVSSDE